MAITTKKYIGDRIIGGLQDANPNIDFRSIDPREVFRVVDDIVNAMARDNYFENWKLFGPRVDDGFITTWDGDNAIEVEGEEDEPSYLTFPANYAALPKNGGIDEIWPINYEFRSVIIRDHSDIRRTRRLMSGNLQGELGGCPKGGVFQFDQINVAENYAETFGMRLVVKDSSEISDTAPYPIPSNIVEEVIKRGIIYFTEKRLQPTDVVRDKQDAINRN